jgi:hypothetical protein
MHKAFLIKWYAQQKVQCASYPWSDAVQKLLSTVDNSEFEDEMTYKQLVTTDCSTLITISVPCEEFIDDLTAEIWTTLHPYSFLAQHQVLTQCKGSLHEQNVLY